MIIDALAGTPYENQYYNYSELEGLSDYTDFIEFTHLKLEAADKYSEWHNHLIFE